mgnify:CR=1 FL=1
MIYVSDLGITLLEHWPIWLVSVTLILAAVIDGFERRVPNWIAFPMIVSGWIDKTAPIFPECDAQCLAYA